MKEVYLFDNGERIEVRESKTDKVIYFYTYMEKGNLTWEHEDAWRQLRRRHLTQDYYKEVFKCECGKILKIPDKFEARCGETNKIEYDLKCDCGNVITIQCDTLRLKKDETN